MIPWVLVAVLICVTTGVPRSLILRSHVGSRKEQFCARAHTTVLTSVILDLQSRRRVSFSPVRTDLSEAERETIEVREVFSEHDGECFFANLILLFDFLNTWRFFVQ